MKTERTINSLTMPKATDARCAGWQALIRTAEVVAGELEGRPVELTADTSTWLTLTMPPTAFEREAVAGVLAAATALSREICALCGGPGDPVRHIDHWLSTRCKGCRTAGQQVLPRHWRRPHRGAGGDKLEDAIGDDDLLALMNAGGEPGEASERWPRRLVGGGSTGLAQSGIDGVGWNHLIRAAYGELVPAGDGRAATVRQIKEKLGTLTIYTDQRTAFWQGFGKLIARVSEQVCIKCGQPGELRNGSRDGTGKNYSGGWLRPECGLCWQASGRK